MSTSNVTWSPDISSLGTATVAIGVFDGVHLGHQALLRDAVADAAVHGVRSVAVTFDRDPDQVVSPATAAPQLLTLADKLAFMAETGIDIVLVVPFTPELAAMSPEAFVEEVLLSSLRPVAVHVGRDFCFGTRASGNVGTLLSIGSTHGFQVVAHDLVSVGGAAVTSTRIRTLVAAGNLEGATALLGRRPRVAGCVHRGRGEGAALGFPTANVVPVPFAALPADGVYAGRALLEDGEGWAAAISVGKPPSFADATDYLEAHLVQFEGDLYDQAVTLEFFERIRDLKRFETHEALTAAIAADVEVTLEIAGFDDEPGEDSGEEGTWEADPFSAMAELIVGGEPQVPAGYLANGEPIVSDPAALEAAEVAVAHQQAKVLDATQDGPWVRLLGPIGLYSALSGSARSFAVTAPLEAADIPYEWDPYPPEERPSGLPGGGACPQPFTLLVPESYLEAAREAVADSPAASELPEAPAGEVADDDIVSDRAALEAAEDAVRHVDVAPQRQATPLEGWVFVAQDVAYDKARLGAISYALAAAGIAADWTPFDPAEAPLLRMFGLHETRFALRVPEDDARAAYELIVEVDARD